MNTEAKKELWSGDDYHDDEYYGFIDMIVNNNNNNNIKLAAEGSAPQLGKGSKNQNGNLRWHLP